MAKGYWMVHIEVTDPAKYEGYKALTPAALAAFGGVFLARGGAAQTLEGAAPGARQVLIEFPSYQAALDCYESELYREAKAAREGAASMSIVVVEGV